MIRDFSFALLKCVLLTMHLTLLRPRTFWRAYFQHQWTTLTMKWRRRMTKVKTTVERSWKTMAEDSLSTKVRYFQRSVSVFLSSSFGSTLCVSICLSLQHSCSIDFTYVCVYSFALLTYFSLDSPSFSSPLVLSRLCAYIYPLSFGAEGGAGQKKGGDKLFSDPTHDEMKALKETELLFKSSLLQLQVCGHISPTTSDVI